ncbi:MAG: hypothetical protein LC785_09655 [Acidobacteria bacterium]|nr:hypothetical protein [Acidobacteriota bacterium]MCA1642195.1 hypothetical protein [Acidobacteriota bacterium]
MKKVKKNRVEWSVFAVSLVLVLGTLGYLVYEGARADKAAPDIGVRLGTPERRTQDFVVPVFVTNSGDETAEGVQIEVVLEGGAEPERGEFTIAFVPRRATREGWVAFRSDPRGARLTPRVLGYEKP